MSTDAEKLAQIAALMTEPGADGIYRWKVGHVRRRIAAILAEPGPVVQPHAIDRDALIALDPTASREVRAWLEVMADAILALVRPVEGDVTWREAEAVLDAIRACAPLNMELRTDPARIGTEDPQTAAYVEGVYAAYYAAKQALAARLEASS